MSNNSPKKEIETISTALNAKQLMPVLTKAMENKFNVLLQSSPGVGKSSLVEQIASGLNYELMISHPTISDAVDYKGFPSIVNGKAEFLPYGDLEKLINAKKPLICLFDDLGNSTPTVQASLMQIILARQINGKPVSKHVRFIACTNRRQDATGVSGLIKALVSRFHMVLEMCVDVNAWKDWAFKNDIPIEIIAFINARPDLLCNFDPKDKDIKNFPCPRTVEFLAKLIKSGINDVKCWAGCVGDGFAFEFAGFFKIYHSIATLPNQIILKPKDAPIPEENNIRYALMGALSHMATEKNLDAIMQYVERLNPEFQVLFVKDMARRNQEMMKTNAYITWALKNSESIQ